ncbi:hypothetical protein HK097_006111 [Rhizophlyctis rosea]|uniref:F-box domain-containing protein n=1 Tax=Rhizophlyctis rosea TaxID=64517 RepID=A0AAD5X5U3_9FUNG|nr:hypothetical protein HK097_006111 [Rhizophlyctis rosea]
MQDSTGQLLSISAYSLPTELWTKIFRYILLPALHKRDCSEIITFLTTCRAVKGLMTSLPEYQQLRNAILRMRYTIFTAKHNLFAVSHRGYDVSGKYVAVLPSDNANSPAFTSKKNLEKMKTTVLSSMRYRAEYGIFLPDDTDFNNTATVTQLCKEYVQSNPNGRYTVEIENHLQALDFLNATISRIDSRLPILQSLPPLPRKQTTVCVV